MPADMYYLCIIYLFILLRPGPAGSPVALRGIAAGRSSLRVSISSPSRSSGSERVWRAERFASRIAFNLFVARDPPCPVVSSSRLLGRAGAAAALS